eukprot:TRINITY_DN12554_c0_g1_i1.p1 TRINITY_DN12554_c0_g1~~TRINITY_DN12554_c0_g1_i1.p1  ORF type:complete len:437 (-),score=133.29 TRINITY_DN12554_c0_g1_i1:350-1660(-)
MVAAASFSMSAAEVKKPVQRRRRVIGFVTCLTSGCVVLASTGLGLSQDAQFSRDAPAQSTPAFVAAASRGASSSSSGGARAAATGCRAEKEKTKNPAKSLVFKFPRKKPPRQVGPGEDDFSIKMRQRLETLKLKPEDPTKPRPVIAAKADDIISKQAEEAQMDTRYTLWKMDQINDRLKEEEQNPDLEVLNRRFDEQMRKLTGVADDAVEPAKVEGASTSTAELELTRELDFDRLQSEVAAGRHKRRTGTAAGVSGSSLEDVEDDSSRGNVEYLQMIQKRSRVEDKISRRVVKSPEERRAEYEAGKGVMFAVTLALGLIGTGAASMMYGRDEAIGFAFGSAAALQYLSGLSAYTDNAESPLGSVLGGRRFLAPVLLIIVIQQWPNFEANYPAIAALNIHPSLFAAIMGFLTYNIGTVASRAFPQSAKPKAAEESAA